MSDFGSPRIGSPDADNEDLSAVVNAAKEATADSPASVYRRLTKQIRIRGYSRTEWQAVCRGAERPLVQRFLVDMAEEATVGTKADQLALLKAAYAVLPLHGQALREFVTLLAEERPPDPEWADALVEALAEEPPGGTLLAGVILRVLSAISQAEAYSDGEKRRLDWIDYHVTSLGYRLDATSSVS